MPYNKVNSKWMVCWRSVTLVASNLIFVEADSKSQFVVGVTSEHDFVKKIWYVETDVNYEEIY